MSPSHLDAGEEIQAGTISWAIERFLETVRQARSPRTAQTYRNALNAFSSVLKAHELPPVELPIGKLPEEAIAWFAEALKDKSPATESLYLTAVAGFYNFLAAENLISVNLPRIRLLIRQRARRPGQRLPQFPGSAIDDLLIKIDLLAGGSVEDATERLRNLRDRAFFYTLADTGLRVHEACNLKRGDIDWNELKAIVIGKGNREAVIRFSERSISAIKDYLKARAVLDGASGVPLTRLPLFARHDPAAGKKIRPMTTTTGRNIVAERVRTLLGDYMVGAITPHSFRHYFVTKVLRTSGNLKLAQELARHRNIAVTQRYAHLSDDELDKGYRQAIEEK